MTDTEIPSGGSADDFAEFYRQLSALVERFKGAGLKTEADLDSEIVKIFGGQLTALSRAKGGLDDVSELSLSEAEHHPYWNLLSMCCLISHIALYKWNDELTASEIDEMRWAISNLDSACTKLAERLQEDK